MALLLLITACNKPPVAVRVTIPNLDGVETPVPDVVLTFLPYDRDSVVRALVAKARPRPHTQELDSLFRAFREPFGAYLRVAASMDRLKAARDSASSDSIAALEPELARLRAGLDRARDTLGPRIDSLRAIGKQWESETYKGYAGMGRALRARAYVNPVADTTDFGGWATIPLPKGDWWITARTIDPRDPNGEWYWNVPIRGDTVRLDPRTGHNRPRY